MGGVKGLLGCVTRVERAPVECFSGQGVGRCAALGEESKVAR